MKAGRPLKKREAHPAPVFPTKTSRDFNLIAKRFGLYEYRLILMQGMVRPDGFVEGEPQAKHYKEACSLSPEGVARLREFIQNTQKRCVSLPEFIEQKPSRMAEPDHSVAEQFKNRVGGLRTVEAVRGAKNALEKLKVGRDK